MSSELIPLVVDTKTRGVGCVLLQAAGGGSVSLARELFAVEGWFTAPSDSTVLMRGTRDQWEAFKIEYDLRFRGINNAKA